MMAIPGFVIRELIYESPRTLVFTACYEATGRATILKVLRDEFPKPEDVVRYRREFEITRGGGFEHVIHAYSLDFVRSRPVLALEDLGGHSLRRSIPRDLIAILEIAIAIAEGIAELHAARIIHKDLNPANVVRNPSTGQVKIIDFGIATLLSRESPALEAPDVLEGTLAYVSPEQTGRMNRVLDHRTDFYSFGVTLYELLTGTVPFSADETLALVHQHLVQPPTPACERNPQVPRALSDVVAKLLAKTAEERYQSAAGIRADLAACLAQLRAHGRIEPFTLARHDVPSQFHLPQKLYGRAAETAILLEIFERASGSGREAVMVAGYSGIGKTRLVRELFKPLTRRRGYFVSGKFDQLLRNIPYGALVDALRDLVRQILAEREERVRRWRGLLAAALGHNGQLIIDVIPEVEMIVGRQPAVSHLPPREARDRFVGVFRSFIRTFLQPEHPLVIFLDDLQWADAATLALLEALLQDEETRHLLVIGAYRDNEVGADHPLAASLDRLACSTIILTPLGMEHLTELVSDALYASPETSRPLAELVGRKTGGNPFFVGQFLTALYQGELIRFEGTRWTWDVARVEEAAITDNVVDLLVGNMARLPAPTLEVLRRAACLGNRFDLSTLALIHGSSLAAAHADLMPAVQEGMLMPTSDLQLVAPDQPLVYARFKFLHDRVQQAAYSLVEEDARHALHRDIGRRLLDELDEPARAERIFELVDHLNLGLPLMADSEERRTLASLDLQAARRAKGAAAYGASLRYLEAAMEAFEGDWPSQYDLTLALHRERAELEYLNGRYDASEAGIAAIWDHAGTLDRAEASCQLITQRTVLGDNRGAIDAAARALHILGMEFPEEEHLQVALDEEQGEIERRLGTRSVASLIDLPPMTDPSVQVAMKVLMTAHTSAYFDNHYRLYSWMLARMTRLSMQYGNVPESSKGYASYGNTIAANLGSFRAGFEFGMLGLALAERYGNLSLKCKACLILSMFLNHWTRPMGESEWFDEEGQAAGMESGELQFIGYILAYGRTINRFHRGVHLARLTSDLDRYLVFTRKVQHHLSTDNILAARRVIHSLAGQPDPQDETGFVARCVENGSLAALCFYQTAQAFVRYLAGENAAARALIDEAATLLGYIKGVLTQAEHNFYHSLILAASSDDDRLEKLERNQQAMRRWAEHCPQNFLCKALLIDAEMARLSGQVASAMEAYDRAIEAAGESGFMHYEALSNELAARFWLGRARPDFATLYLRRARAGYAAWGARVKEAALVCEFPHLADEPAGSSPPRHLDFTDRAVIADLDLAAVMKAAQAISSEIVLDRLLDRLLRVVLESAGAERASLVLLRDGELRVAATSDGETRRCDLPLDAASLLPGFLVRYVARTRESVVIRDAATDARFAADPYLSTAVPRSVLCQPLLYRGDLAGVLYLENNRAAGVFSSDRVELLTLLSSHAAIAIQNAVLYESLVAEMAEHRRMEELTIAKEAAEAAARTKGEFLANMSHEVRTPMTAILGFARLALQQEVSPRVRDYLKKIDSAGRSLLGILNDILDVSKMEAGRLELEQAPFALREAVEGVYDLFAQQAAEQQIDLRVDVSAAVPPMVVGDPLRLGQVLINLTGNAVKFTRRGGVEVGVELVERLAGNVRLRFTVSDSGVGMTPQQMERLFEPFAQADASTTRLYGGTGLGLAISRRLVALMGGEIAVESAVGQGSRFSFTLSLPLASDVPHVQATPSPPQIASGGRILVVEDNPMNRELLVELLASAGFDVDVAATGAEAVRMVDGALYDAVLMDVQMPEMDGFEATRRIREKGHCSLPIVAATAHALPSHRAACLAHGMDDCLTKPIDPDVLLRTISRWTSPGERPAREGDGEAEFEALRPFLDVSAVWDRVGHDGELLRRLLRSFVAGVESDGTALQEALRASDLKAARRAVHTVVGAAATLSAGGLLAAARELERALDEDAEAQWAAPLERFLTAVAALRERLRDYLGEISQR